MSSVTADPPTSTSTDRLSLESIPTVDLRLLSQSELTALSRCSSKAFDLSRCDDVVIPKIDRSVFNESAGSRKQTYSRLRLAPRKPDISSLKTRPATPGPHVIDDPERAENARIITLFKKLFNLDSHGGELVPINVQCSETMPGVSNVALPNYVGGSSGEIVMKRKRGRKPMSEKLASVAIASSSQLAVVVAESVNTVPVVNDTEAIEKETVNKNGVALDLAELAKVDDPYGAEIRRRTDGLVKDEELLGFLSNLSGQWVSRRKKRKIVDANEFGDALPKEWKVMIGMKRKQGSAWLFCRRYISPSGRHFASCKEVSAYLLSLNGLQNTDQPNSIQCTRASNMENIVASANAEDTPSFDNPPSSHIYQANDHQKQPSLSNDADIGKVQLAASFKCHKCSTAFYEKDGLLHHLISCHKRKRRKSGMPIEDDCLVTKDGRYECQFCDKTFHERPSYFGHVGIHVKNYVRSMGESPGVATNQMRFETIFTDRATPTASEGLEPMQVDGESITATPVATHNENNVGQHQVDSESVAVTAVDMAPIEHDIGRHQVDSESVTAIPVATSLNEHNVGHHQCDMLSHSDTMYHLDDNKLNILSPNVEENIKDVGSGKALSEDFSKNGDEITRINHKLRKVEEASDISVARHSTYSSIDKMELDDENTEVWEGPIESCLAGKTGTEIDETIVRQVANANSRSVTGDGQARLGNDDDRLPSDMIAGPKEQTVSGTDVLAGHNTKLLSDNEFEDGLLRNEVGEISTRDRVEFRNGIDLLFGSGSEHVGSDVDFDNSLQHKSSESSSAASLQEKETYDNGDNINEAIESTLVSSKLEGGTEPGSSAPSMDTQTCSINDYVERASNGTTADASFETCSLKKNLLSLDADSSCPKDIMSENEVCTLSENKENDYIVTHAKVVSGDKLLESSREGAPKDSPLPFCIAQLEQDAVIENNVGEEVLPGEIEEPGSSKIINSGNSFFASGNSDNDVNATVANCNEPDKATACFLPASSGNRGLLAGESDLFSSYNSFLPPKHDVSRNISSSTSFVEHRLGLNSEMHNASDHMSQSSAATSAMQLPEQQHKMESSRANMVPYFASDMASMNTNVAPSGRQVTVSEASPFSLWNDQSFAFEGNQKSVFDGTRVEARQERASASNSLPLDSFEQTCDMGYNLNEAYVGTVQGFPRLDEPTRNTELMIGYRSNHERSNQDVGTDALWRTNEGDVLPGGLGDASSRGQLSGSFQAFDFLSDKGGNDMYSIDDKFDNMSSFDGLRSATVEPMEFSFLTTQHSNAQLQDPKVLSYGNAGGIPGFDSSIWLEKGSSLSNMATGPVSRTTMCVWCGSEFQQEPFGYETEAGSIGSLCPTCKARISGQFL